MKRLWRKVLERRQKYPRKILYEDPEPGISVLRDFVGAELDKIRVDSRQTFDQLKRFTEEFARDGQQAGYYQAIRRSSISTMSRTRSSGPWNARSS